MLDVRVPATDDEREAAWRLAATLNAAPSCQVDSPIGGMLRHPGLEWVAAFDGDECVGAVVFMVDRDPGAYRSIVAYSLLPGYWDQYALTMARAVAACDWPDEAVIGASLSDSPPEVLAEIDRVFGAGNITRTVSDDGGLMLRAPIHGGVPLGGLV